MHTMNDNIARKLFVEIAVYLNYEQGDLATEDYYQKLRVLLEQQMTCSDQLYVLKSNFFNRLRLCSDQIGFQSSSSELRFANIQSVISKTHGSLNIWYWLFTKATQTLDVLFVSHDANSRGHIYRVKYVCDALNQYGLNVAWLEESDLRYFELSTLNLRRLLVFRCEATPSLQAFIRNRRKDGVIVIYDIDDLVFDASVIEKNEIDFIAKLADKEKLSWVNKIDSYHRVMSMADKVCVPTAQLKKHATRLFNQCVVFPNTFDLTKLKVSNCVARKQRSKNLIIGYASGTPTHEKDFETVKPAIVRLMAYYPDIELRIVGSLDIINGSDFEQFRGRIVTRPLVEHSDLPLDLAEFDINIIPLERNRFTDSKSELKFFESALLNIPSIATSNPVYEQTIRHGENGYLATDHESWFKLISQLIENVAQRDKLGRSANRDAIKHYHINNLVDYYCRQVISL